MAIHLVYHNDEDEFSPFDDRENENSNYVFTKDYEFNSKSAAACIVSGQSRSGPDVWKKI
jgi:uncharacterized protein DUF4357